MPRAGYVPQHTHDDPAIQGVDLAVRELGELAVGLDEGCVDLVVQATTRAHTEAVARWEASAEMSKGNVAGPRGFRRAHRTQRYREAIRKIFFDDGHTGKVFISYPVEDDRGKRPKNLPLWLEYSTVKMAARAHLIPAFELAKAWLDRGVAQLLAKVAR